LCLSARVNDESSNTLVEGGFRREDAVWVKITKSKRERLNRIPNLGNTMGKRVKKTKKTGLLPPLSMKHV